MNLESKKITLSKTPQYVFEKLENLASFEGLMPENIEKFQIDGESFIFGLKGMPEIRLVLKEKVEYSRIVLGAASSKIPFTLSLELNKIDENTTEAQLLFKGEFNPMIGMMVKKPLTSFIGTLIENVEKL
ncbi:MAG: SRPBCC family protein [Flavicella sp.]